MSDKKNVHVVPHPEGGWAIRREIARNNQVDVVIHGRDGRIRGAVPPEQLAVIIAGDDREW